MLVIVSSCIIIFLCYIWYLWGSYYRPGNKRRPSRILLKKAHSPGSSSLKELKSGLLFFFFFAGMCTLLFIWYGGMDALIVASSSALCLTDWLGIFLSLTSSLNLEGYHEHMPQEISSHFLSFSECCLRRMFSSFIHHCSSVPFNPQLKRTNKHATSKAWVMEDISL